MYKHLINEIKWQINLPVVMAEDQRTVYRIFSFALCCPARDILLKNCHKLKEDAHRQHYCHC